MIASRRQRILQVAGSVALAACLLLPQAAAASTVYITYSGTVTQSQDLAQVFGKIDTGNSYVGAAYSVTYAFDPALAHPGDSINGGPQLQVNGNSDWRFSSGIWGPQPSFQSYTVSIQGSPLGSFTFVRPDVGAVLAGQNNGVTSSESANVAGQVIYPSNPNQVWTASVYSQVGGAYDPNLPGSYNQFGTVAFTPDQSDLSDFTVATSGNSGREYTVIRASIDSFSISSTPPGTVAAVPEPATWVMSLVGFLGLGVLANRRRRFGVKRASTGKTSGNASLQA